MAIKPDRENKDRMSNSEFRVRIYSTPYLRGALLEYACGASQTLLISACFWENYGFEGDVL